jgi:putative SOS response-associated peptidase YedK
LWHITPRHSATESGEWARQRVKHTHSNRGISAFAFAGLWEEWKGPDGPVRSCTIVTTEPNELMEPIHNRMPVILPKDYEDVWLDPEWCDIPEILELLRPYPAEKMKAIPLSTLVNSPKNENADVIVPLGDFPNSK